jgi:hypothetical protein
MNLEYYLQRFSANSHVFEALTKGITAEQARWKPSAEKWSILEVVNHLSDEEKEDFRQRLDLTLDDPKQTWPRIDPQDWVTTRRYNEKDLDTSLNNFFGEREKSLSWLRQLTTPNWEHRYQHPDGRTISAGDLLASWLAHDYLHVRQLARLHWQYVAATAAPYETSYGGPWKES